MAFTQNQGRIENENKKRNKFQKKTYCIALVFGGNIFVSIYSLYGFYLKNDNSDLMTVMQKTLLSLFNTICVFAMNLDFGFVEENIAQIGGIWCRVYEIYAALLVVLAPVLTFSVVLSFFKNASAYLKFACHFNNDIYVFSELNEKSLALAKSTQKDNVLFVFADVYSDDDEYSSEFLQKAKLFTTYALKRYIRYKSQFP